MRAIMRPGPRSVNEAPGAADTDTVGGGYGEFSEIAIAVATDAPGLDLALWVFGGCGPDAGCLAFVDEQNAGGGEVLEWSHREPEARTVYLAVDCINAPPDAASGAFELSFDATTPTRARSITGVRNRFR